ncbi:PHB depolymerase family esterase [Burkholderia ubonensis]|uniref:extracellular catalytic domain type 2 short-chain-length polyhydroxyalkanoate depolymerase n=1 Tax=Burkholderia ubonensis TaxID=101571 RepID=UPI000756EDCB|nr:depolymerase [Burkholderia ubonensis]
MKFHRTLAAAAIGAALCSRAAFAVDPLPALGADPAHTSVSGLSSGAFMAVQYQVAYSNSVVGSGIVAGGPYYCATGKLANTSKCMGMLPGSLPNPAQLLRTAKGFAARGEIDPLAGLQSDRIYVFSGTKDKVVYQRAVDTTVSFFKDAGVPPDNLTYVKTIPAGHALITPDFGNNCPITATPYINHCTVDKQSYDQPGALLSFIYGPLNPPADQPAGKIIAFNQREFAGTATGMAEQAYAYVPQACTQGTACRVHVAFHGCKQSASVVGDDFYQKTSYNRWADTNNIVVLYPQVDASKVPNNPQGCWDWFGYTGKDYAVKAGVQMAAVNAMIGRLTSKP